MQTLRLVAFTILLSVSAPSFADDWTAAKLRGSVLQLVDMQWQPLQRGMVIPDSRVIRTLAMGHVTLVRGEETLDLGPNTQIQIQDRAGAKPFTTVKEYFGTVSVEAQVQNVQHFAVETKYLAAVVKGTRFTVTSNKTGASVSVRRGHVEVDDYVNKTRVTISVGQSAAVGTGGQINVSGTGVIPVVLDAKGHPIGEPGDKGKGTADDKKKDKGEKSKGSGESGKGKSGASGSGGSNSGKGKGKDHGHDD